MSDENPKKSWCKHHGTSGGAYGLGIIGAVVYYIHQADGFWMGALGILKALFWPAILVYHLLQFLNVS